MAKEQKKIEMTLCYGAGYSYYADKNNILKGEWGGYEECHDCTFNGEAMYLMYYGRFQSKVPITKFGLFYGLFSCLKYDGVFELPACNHYITEKNGRFGLINPDGKEILHTVYNEIKPYFMGISSGSGMRYISLFTKDISFIWKDDYKENVFFIVETESGKFLFNLSHKTESAVYEDIIICNNRHYSQIIYKENEKYGVLDIDGRELLKPYYRIKSFASSLFYKYQDMIFDVWVKEGLLYGKLPTNEYDICFRIGSDFFSRGGYYYIVKSGDKYGLISDKLQLVSVPVLDEIILYKRKNEVTDGCLHIYETEDSSRCIDITFVIARKDNKYRLYNTQNGHLIVDGCDCISYISSGNKDVQSFVEFRKGDINGYVLWNENIICTNEYEEINVFDGNIYVKKDGKYGVIKPNGKELLPCIYDMIKGTRYGEFTLVKDGKEEKVYMYSQHQSNNNSYERPTYEKYGGSYAQDEMGYSDDDIDTIFDGDPDAYWNID